MFFKQNKTKKTLISMFLAVLIAIPVVFAGYNNVSAVKTIDEMAGKESSTMITTDGSQIERTSPLKWLGSIAAKIGMWVLTIPLIILRKFAAVLLTMAMSMLDMMLSDQMYSQVFFSPEARAAINTGWGLVRDFVNMFYVLILIFLAIATILRVNKFSDKKLLLSVVISALLVNFSKAIALFIIDASNLAMNFFLANIHQAGASYSELLAEKMSFSSLFSGNSIASVDGGLVIGLSEIIFTTIFAITLFVLAIALLIRMVAFWVLLVLSPLAFFGLTLPGTFLSNLYKNWLEKMTSWAFFGPILLFFLWLALEFVSALAAAKLNAPVHGFNQTPIAIGQATRTFVINFFRNTMPFIAAIYFLFYGFDISKKVAAKAGSSVGGLMNKGGNWMSKGLKTSAIAGTGVAGLAGYSAYSAGRDRYRAGKEKLEESDSKARILTKKGRVNMSKDRVDRYKDPEKFNRKKMNEKLKDWKEQGSPSAEQQNRIDKKGSKVEKMALAMHRAEKGKLNTAEDYNKAIAAMGKDKVSTGKLRGMAEKKNLHAVMESDIGHANSAIIGGSDAELDQAVDQNAALREMVSRENERRAVNGKTKADKAPMSKDQARAYVRSAHKADTLVRDVYKNKIQTMSTSAMGQQDINFHRNINVTNAIRDTITSLPTETARDRKREELRKFANRDKNMTPAKTKAWMDAHII